MLSSIAEELNTGHTAKANGILKYPTRLQTEDICPASFSDAYKWGEFGLQKVCSHYNSTFVLSAAFK